MPNVSMPGLKRDRERALSESQFERILGNASRLAIVAVGCIVPLVAVQSAQVILAPVALAVVIGLMFGPLPTGLRPAAPSALSARIVVLLQIAVIVAARGPMIWEKLRSELLNRREPLQWLMALQDQVTQVFAGNAAMTVSVGGGGLTSLAMLAPAIGAQVIKEKAEAGTVEEPAPQKRRRRRLEPPEGTAPVGTAAT